MWHMGHLTVSRIQTGFLEGLNLFIYFLIKISYSSFSKWFSWFNRLMLIEGFFSTFLIWLLHYLFPVSPEVHLLCDANDLPIIGGIFCVWLLYFRPLMSPEWVNCSPRLMIIVLFSLLWTRMNEAKLWIPLFS